MKSMLFTVIALLMAVQVSAFDLNQAKPGMLFGPADPERARLFTDQKPVQNFLHRPLSEIWISFVSVCPKNRHRH